MLHRDIMRLTRMLVSAPMFCSNLTAPFAHGLCSAFDIIWYEELPSMLARLWVRTALSAAVPL